MLPSELETLALRYVPGEGPVTLERVGSGLVNESYRAARGGRLFSLRVPAPHAVELGLDREWESRVLERAMAAGIAPIIERCEPRQGILVARWVDGRAWTLEQVRRTENIEKIAQLARHIHALPVPLAARMMSPAAWIAHYHEALARLGVDANRPLRGGRRLLELRPGLEARLAALAEPPPVSPVLCHSDLHPQNLIADDLDLIVLDWEYAHVSEPFWDLAGWIANNDLGADSRRVLLASYLGRPPTPREGARLQRLIWLYDYVCLLWSELYSKLRADISREDISGRARVLAERLTHAGEPP
jgi:thiamine kinase-like enzyme